MSCPCHGIDSWFSPGRPRLGSSQYQIVIRVRSGLPESGLWLSSSFPCGFEWPPLVRFQRARVVDFNCEDGLLKRDPGVRWANPPSRRAQFSNAYRSCLFVFVALKGLPLAFHFLQVRHCVCLFTPLVLDRLAPEGPSGKSDSPQTKSWP